MFDAWDMNHAEAVLERLFFEIAKTDVGNVFDTSIPKDFKEGLRSTAMIRLSQPSTKKRALSSASTTAKASPSMGA